MSSTQLHSALPSVNSIRLLRLQPGDEDDPLSCDLIVVEDYASALEYNALSYCWGDTTGKIELLCNETPFAATKNLYSALQCLRKRAPSQLVWADAICINQNDSQERNQQLSIMKQIYLFASRVFIWIGHGNENTELALNLIRDIGHGCCKEIYGSDLSPASWLASLRKDTDRTQAVTSTNFAEIVEQSRIDWQLIWKFYESSWFFRVWVIQEVRQCMDILLLCGGKEIEWEFVVLAGNWVSHAFDRDPKIHWTKNYLPSLTGFQNVFFMWDQSLCIRREAPFLALLNLVRRFHSTDPRDKVFALLQHPILQIRAYDQDRSAAIKYPSESAKTARVTHINFRADYEMTTREVYRQVALDSIECYRNLEVLCYAWQTQHLDTSLSSWIPRWDVPFDVRTVLLPFIYDAARGTVPKLQPSPEPDILTVQGFNLGTVVEIDCVLRFGEWLAPVNCSDKEKSTESLLMIMSRILVQDRWQEDVSLETAARRSSENPKAHFADFSAFLLSRLKISKQDSYIPLCTIWCDSCKQIINEQRKPTSSLSKVYNCQICLDGDYDLCAKCYDMGKRCHDPIHVPRIMTTTSFWCPYTDDIMEQLEVYAANGDGDRFFKIAHDACRERSFLGTATGWKGLSAQTVESGDVLAVFFGSRIPFILRRAGNFFRLISDSYIYGLMDGEALRMWEEGTLKIEDFAIR